MIRADNQRYEDHAHLLHVRPGKSLDAAASCVDDNQCPIRAVVSRSDHPRTPARATAGAYKPIPAARPR